MGAGDSFLFSKVSLAIQGNQVLHLVVIAHDDESSIKGLFCKKHLLHGAFFLIRVYIIKKELPEGGSSR